MDTIPQNQIKDKKRVGTLDGTPVVQMETVGGLYLWAVSKGQKTEILSCAPHPGVCKYLAQKKNPRLIVKELCKAEILEEASILSVLPRYEFITQRLNDLIKKVVIPKLNRVND
jgi:hypothetical protein